MSISPDFSKLATWERLDLYAASERLSYNQDGGYNDGALKVCSDVADILTTQDELAQFFFNCETMKLRGWKLWDAYKQYSKEDYTVLIKAVMNSDKAMQDLIAEIEEQLNPKK